MKLRLTEEEAAASLAEILKQKNLLEVKYPVGTRGTIRLVFDSAGSRPPSPEDVTTATILVAVVESSHVLSFGLRREYLTVRWGTGKDDLATVMAKDFAIA